MFFADISVAFSGCFNRYMVECESISFTVEFVCKFGFNRYMVECE